MVALSFGVFSCGSPGRQTPDARAPNAPVVPDSEIPSLAWVEGLVGRCPHPVAPKAECSELKAKAIQVCNEHKANPCMETAIQFETKGCDPKITSDMAEGTMEYACGLGSWASCVWLSSSLFKSGDDVKRQKALEMAQKTCLHGEAEGCVNVASMLAWWYGHGNPRDSDLAQTMDWAKRGCDLGSKRGCNDYALGLIQRNQGSDKADARKLLDTQCTKGFESSCVTLGYEESIGAVVLPNPPPPT
jgi:hypothetical protein